MSRRAFDLDEPYVGRDITNSNPDGVLAMARPGGGVPLMWASLRLFDAPGTRDKRTAAAVYATLGLHPIALHGPLDDGACTCGRRGCQAVGKHPIESRWQTAELDRARLDRMLSESPRFNLGLRTGRQPNGRFLVVIDVDGPRSLLDPLEREGGTAFPATLTARTGRGGLHLYYWLRDGIEISNRTGIVPHVDIRGTRGQVVGSPSRHVSGAYYEWLDVREPEVLT